MPKKLILFLLLISLFLTTTFATDYNYLNTTTYTVAKPPVTDYTWLQIADFNLTTGADTNTVDIDSFQQISNGDEHCFGVITKFDLYSGSRALLNQVKLVGGNACSISDSYDTNAFYASGVKRVVISYGCGAVATFPTAPGYCPALNHANYLRYIRINGTYNSAPNTIADFNYSVNKDLNYVQLYDQSSTSVGVIHAWTWRDMNTNTVIGTTQDLNYTVAELTDYNICLTADANTGAYATTCKSFNTGEWTPPVTTFSSFQVSNTTDQNITLNCIDNNVGCSVMQYNVDSTGWHIAQRLLLQTRKGKTMNPKRHQTINAEKIKGLQQELRETQQNNYARCFA